MVDPYMYVDPPCACDSLVYSALVCGALIYDVPVCVCSSCVGMLRSTLRVID